MNKEATQKIKEITQMNIRWQKYSKQQDGIVTELRINQKENTDKIHKLQSALNILENQYEVMELKYTDAKVRATERKWQLENRSIELDDLQHKLDVSKQEATTLKNRCADLFKEVNQIQKNTTEEIEVYKNQVRKNLCNLLKI